MAYIYKITNIINQKSYIGKTEYEPAERRWKQHQAEAKRKSKSHRTLYRAINKYGVQNFQFIILEQTNNPNEREQYYIQLFDTYHNGYNETLGGDGCSYLELPEQKICDYYLNNHTLEETVTQFQHDPLTIKKILQKNNIQLRTQSDTMQLSLSYSVAKIHPQTNEIIEVYPSIKVAELANGNTRHITDVVNGKRKTCKGYKWIKIIKE